jgi:hypothetical protein
LRRQSSGIAALIAALILRMGFAAQRRDRQAALRESIATGRLTEAVAPDLVWDMSAFGGWSGEPTSTGTPGSPGSWKRGVSPTALGVWPSSSSSTRGDDVLAIVTQRGRLGGSGAEV